MRVLAEFRASVFFWISSMLVSPMVGWPSVKKTTVKVRPSSLGAQFQGGGQGVVDGGAAGRFQSVHPFAGLLQLLRLCRLESLGIMVDRGGEVEDGEAVALVQVFETVLERVASLGHLGAAHAAGGIQHQHQVARNLLLLGHSARGDISNMK